MPSGTTQVPNITASTDNEAVKIDIQQSQSTTGRAIVNCDYNGVVKTYNIHFTDK
ncbi:hypothetical protein [Marinilabilia salmonicolor]|uniref:hypothetical protein n=1 Tax=Marinilabilia salmonicolor TaxID=989 RepID=UPI001F31DA6F|nr:hypothetical protein [Marinilabilia salmonicolor]